MRVNTFSWIKDFLNKKMSFNLLFQTLIWYVCACLFFLALLTILGVPLKAQNTVLNQASPYSSVTTGTVINLTNNSYARFFRITFYPIGAPASCTVAVDSSLDNSAWSAGNVIAGQTCTSPGSFTTSTAANFNFIRVNVTALSASTSVNVILQGLDGFPSGTTTTVAGNLSNNTSGPSNNNIGALGFVANVAAPSVSEGLQVLGSVTLKQEQRVVLSPARDASSALAKNASSALVTSRVGKASAGWFYGVTYTNTNAATRFLMCFDATSLPGNGTVPDFGFSIPVTTGQVATWSSGGLPVNAATGVVCANSTTQATLTIGSADGLFGIAVQ